MNQLSEQLEAVAKAPGIYVHPGYVEVLRRAIALAKRYEDAPVSIIEGYRLDWDETLQFSAWTKQVRALNGQRVRIVLDKDG